MKKYLEYWQQFWWEEVPPHAFALIRIALGCFLVIYWCVYLPRVAMLFSDRGLVIPYFDALPVPSLPVAYAIYAMTLVLITTFLLGWQLRITGMLLCAVMLYYWLLSFQHFPSSYNRIILFVTFLLTCGGADRTLSLRMRVKRGSWTAWEPIAAWPQRIIAVQITALYLGVGLQKAILDGWHGGAIVENTFMNAWTTPFGYWIAQRNVSMIVFDVLAWAIEILQGVLPIGLWIRWLRPWCVGAAIFFHLSVTAVMGMWWFLVLVPLYLVFYHPDDVRRWCSTLFSST